MYETIVCKYVYTCLHLKTSVTKNNMPGYVGSCVAMKDEGLAMITMTTEYCGVYQTRAIRKNNSERCYQANLQPRGTVYSR